MLCLTLIKTITVYLLFSLLIVGIEPTPDWAQIHHISFIGDNNILWRERGREREHTKAGLNGEYVYSSSPEVIYFKSGERRNKYA